MSELLSARELGEIVGLGESWLNELAQRGRIPSVAYGKQRRYELEAVKAALAGRVPERRDQDTLHCYACKRELPRDAFLTITVKDKRCRPGHSLVTKSSDCRDCRNEQKRELRRKKAEAEGRAFVPRGDRAVWEAQQRATRAQRKAERRVAWAICVAFWRLVSMSPEERRRKNIERIVRRQAVRYRTDPDYQARVKAKKIRRKRAMRGTQVVPVNRERVAKRDGWCCGICGGKVTRENWSLDHVVPLSKGGSHTYDNVVLAHLSCNVKRGVGKLAVQAPLFARP